MTRSNDANLCCLFVVADVRKTPNRVNDILKKIDRRKTTCHAHPLALPLATPKKAAESGIHRARRGHRVARKRNRAHRPAKNRRHAESELLSLSRGTRGLRERRQSVFSCTMHADPNVLRPPIRERMGTSFPSVPSALPAAACVRWIPKE